MRIPNYDKNRNTNPKRRLNNFLDEDFRIITAGKSNCGKTNTLVHMLRLPLCFYDKIYLYTLNSHQDKIHDLKTLMDKISDKVGCPVLEIGSADDIKTRQNILKITEKILFSMI